MRDRRWIGATLAAGLAGLVVAGCGGSPRHPATQQSSLFAYDASRPLAYRDRGRVNHDYPIAIHDVSYAVPGGRVQAFLAVPPGRGRRPAVIYVHGSGGDRTELIYQASWLAARGALALTITAPSTPVIPKRPAPVDLLREQRGVTVRDVVAVRRAVDLLQSLPRVDPRRIGYTGFSAGARLGAIVAGVEPRLHALVLMSGGSAPVSAYVAQMPQRLKRDAERILGQIDPLRSIARARPGSLLILDGRRDEIVPRAALLAMIHAAPKGTVVRWFDAGHAPGTAAWRAQLAWISTKLGIAGPRVAGARTGP
jgi:dienelactone hydrolase